MATGKDQAKSEEVAHLEQVFKLADKNGDGFLSESELTHLLRVDMGRNVSDIAIKGIFALVYYKCRG
ncbi:hypothetical protein KUTeg_008717 [Tegillarca granosa]|uniref:EF-hand domain-containing protein n=1 Tax=Tegillarca granosa TaxID=220873 RepID=A0ABQ9FD48_TEGGR|nr:hypothetical protein KUTeg_008717 [Tegillarca granosa]